MYAYFKGLIADIEEDAVVLECNNIGYRIYVPTNVISSLPGIGMNTKIYTYTCVREDAFILYGFLTKDDLSMFKKLITVNGIGPKGALGILSTLSTDNLRFAILAGDSKAISKAPGIGAKSAERIILELKNKVDLQFEPTAGNLKSGQESSTIDVTARKEAVEALVALGYQSSEALKAVNQIEITDNMDSGEILKAALKAMSRL